MPWQRWAIRIAKWLALWAVTTLVARGFSWIIDYDQGWGHAAFMGGYMAASVVSTALIQERKSRRCPADVKDLG